MSGRRALLALAATAALAAGGCGGGDDREAAGGLRWQAQPTLVQPARLPGDRILTGTLRNDGMQRADLVAADLRLLTADGKRVPASARFLQTFVHGMFPPTREPGGQEPNWEQLRVGKIARVQPGKFVPLTIAWHEPDGAAPVRIEWSGGSLPIPDVTPRSTDPGR